jgi:hypothetical protein
MMVESKLGDSIRTRMKVQALQAFEHAIRYARATPAHHPHIDRVQLAVLLGQGAPFAAIGRHTEDRVDDLPVV